VGLIAAVLWRKQKQKKFELTGQDSNRVRGPAALVLLFAVLGWLVGGMPTDWNVPVQEAFMVDGGVAATPEFMAILVGLVIYTAAFIAEAVRSGIQSVSRGQTEAASALGLNPKQGMNLVVLPQALRVIIPPVTNQFLNLTKNSSLAVAVGYPDVVSITMTSLNQSGRAVECVAIIMLVYLTTSLSTSAFMNWFNQRMAIQER
jgi:general L-amino acid transport system permease protein